MKKIIILTFTLFLLSTHLAFAEVNIIRSSDFAGQWPYHSTKAIAFDEPRDLVYLGNGDRISVLDTDLNLITSYTLISTGVLSGIYYDSLDMRLYAACKNGGLRILDLADPSNPVAIGSFFPEDGSEVNGVYVFEQKAFLASGLAGIKIIDAGDPADLILLSELGLPGAFGISYAIDIYADAGHAWVADLYNGIHGIDTADPANPKLSKIVAAPGARDLSVVGSYLYTALEGNGVAVIDISDPDDPKGAGQYLADGVEKSVRVDGDFAFVAYGSDGIKVLNVADKTKLTTNPNWKYADSGAISMALVPETDSLLITNEDVGMQKIDVEFITAMQPVAEFDTPADARAINVAGNYLYVVDDKTGNDPGLEGMRILNIAVTNQVIQFFLKGFCETPGQANDIRVYGEYAYIADGDEGLQIISVSDKFNPEIVGSLKTTGTAKRLFVDGNHVYIAAGEDGIHVINITNKENPVPVSTIDTSGEAEGIFVNGNYLYIADGSRGLRIYDISDKSNPAAAGELDTTGNAGDVFVDGDFAYVADGDFGLVIIDIADKSAPHIISEMDTTGDAISVSVSGSFAYIADSGQGMRVADVSDPALPAEIEGWAYQSTGTIFDIFSGFSVDEELFAFIADGPAGVIAVGLKTEKEVVEEEKKSSSGGCFIGTAMNDE